MTSSALKSQLTVFIARGQAESMIDYLSSLRNADFRLAGKIMAQKELWDRQDFWHYASALVKADNKAYLGTMLKAAVTMNNTNPSEEFKKACTTDIDRRKVLESLLPIALHPDEARRLLSDFAFVEPDAQSSEAAKLSLLFRVGTPVSYFLLFNRLKQYDDRKEVLRRYGVELIRKGDKHSFNLACIIQEYFALPSLPGTFSLALPPYELSRLETSFESFKNILQR